VTKRRNIPKDIETKILTKSRRHCCLCVFLKGDDEVKSGQIAHIDKDPANNDEGNLAFLCLEHHNEYDSRPSQSKGLTEAEVKYYRDLLYNTYVQKTHSPKGVIEVYEAGTIEVGYNCFGATIGLSGTLRVVGTDIFVSKIRLSLTVVGDDSIRSFDWLSPRQEEIAVVNIRELSSRPPTAFMLPSSQPYDYDTLFIDTQLHDKVDPIIEDILREWNRSSLNIRNVRELIRTIPEAHATVLKGLKRSYVDFQKTCTYEDSCALLKKYCYWTPGTYELQMHIKTSRPDGEFSKSWRFELTEQDACELRQNAVIILQDICGLQVIYERACDYGFAHVKYQPKG